MLLLCVLASSSLWGEREGQASAIADMQALIKNVQEEYQAQLQLADQISEVEKSAQHRHQQMTSIAKQIDSLLRSRQKQRKRNAKQQAAVVDEPESVAATKSEAKVVAHPLPTNRPAAQVRSRATSPGIPPAPRCRRALVQRWVYHGRGRSVKIK